MAETFEEYVAKWDTLVAQIEVFKRQMKPLVEKEMEMRRAIHRQIAAAMGDLFKEGMNNYPMLDGRKLKVQNGIKREIDTIMIPVAREAYRLLNHREVPFDDLLRTKFELSKVDWNKVSVEGKAAVSVMITSKPDTPSVVLD